MPAPDARDSSPTRDLVRLGAHLRDHLLTHVLPFWARHAVDPDGGLNTCIDDAGAVLSRDKWLWSQWRAVWVFSELYRGVERRTQWLDLAWATYRFTVRHGWDEHERGWRLLLDHTGKTLRGCESLYVDGFAIYGLTALARATGADEPLAWARRTAEAAWEKLQRPHETLPLFPYPVPAGERVHGVPMIFCLVLWELGELTGDRVWAERALRLCDEITSVFLRPDRDLVLERVAVDGTELPPPRGTAVVPGHVLEDLWFQLHIRHAAGHTDHTAELCRLVLRHVELGWDAEHGGVLLAVDADGRADVDWAFASAKLWWPQVEAMYALLLGQHFTGDARFLAWSDRVHAYAFTHFPVATGEWTQKLDRLGRPFTTTVALPVKDPFHLPRALLLCAQLLLTGRPGGTLVTP